MKKLLILGMGDVAYRTLPFLTDWDVVAPTRAQLDLDELIFEQLPSCADALLYTVPPPNIGEVDTRVSALLNFWRTNLHAIPNHIVYISTSGVYGDCRGAWIDESRPVHPESARARRRVDAELRLQDFAMQTGVSLTILRVPGIYALERLPLRRIREGFPVLNAAHDSYSNHIHADDLAQMCAVALSQARGVSVYNACDDEPIKMGDWFCALAQAIRHPIPQRCDRQELFHHLSDVQWSFVRESRRLRNNAIKRDLGVALLYPSVLNFLAVHQTMLAKLRFS